MITRSSTLVIVLLTILWLYPSLAEEKSLADFRLKTVVIDPGHGGRDYGCSGNHSHEKDIALPIALKVGEFVKLQMPNVNVLYTRNSDQFVELHERASLANRNHADLFISIHCNSASAHKSVSGTETYVMGVDKTRENLNVARRENKAIAYESNYQANYDGFDLNDPQSDIIFSLYQNAHLEESINFALFVEEELKNTTKRVSRGVKQESFLVLYKTTMPSVLIETGFLTNNEDESYLESKLGQSQVANSIFKAFERYKNQVELGSAFTSPKVELEVPEINVPLNHMTYRIELFNANSTEAIGKPQMENVAFDIEKTKSGEQHFMVCGTFDNFDTASNRLNEIKQKGFTQAHIVVFIGNQRQ